MPKLKNLKKKLEDKERIHYVNSFCTQKSNNP